MNSNTQFLERDDSLVKNSLMANSIESFASPSKNRVIDLTRRSIDDYDDLFSPLPSYRQDDH